MKLLTSIVAGGVVAALLTGVGAHDLECYENAFFSIDRGTDVRAVTVAGYPVFTLALGLGVRLPIHGNLGASPAAALAPLLPTPLTYWLLLTTALSAAMLIVRLALEPIGGRTIAWLAVTLLFCSVPMVSYTAINDWLETAVTYCSLVGCVFAPHALMEAGRNVSPGRRHLARLSLLGMVYGLACVAHPGYWPQLAVTVGLSVALVLVRPTYRPHDRVMAMVGVGIAAGLGTLVHVPDIARELTLGAALSRDTQGPAGNVILANLFPITNAGDREPFTFLLPALVAMLVAAKVKSPWRRLVIASGLISIAFGLVASVLAPGSFVLAPSATWTLRDPAIAFAVLSAGVAVSALQKSRGLVIVAVLLAVQGPLYAGTLLWSAANENAPEVWNHDFSTPKARLLRRGMPVNATETGNRVALWPGVRAEMRLDRRASTDWADAGYQLLTAWTKVRTMAGVVSPNGMLFDQTTDLQEDALCNAAAVTFLQLQTLLMPPEQACTGWTVRGGAQVDDRWAVAVFGSDDWRVRTIALDDLSDEMRNEPALSGTLALVNALHPQPGTSLAIGNDRLSLKLTDAARDGTVAIVLPVAYDPAWQASAGRVIDLGGLVAVVDADVADVGVYFQPDVALRVRAMGMALSQLLALAGLVCLGVIGWQARPST